MKRIGFIVYISALLLTKVSSAQTWQWAMALTDSLNLNIAEKITVDKLGNSYVAGYFKFEMEVDSLNSLISQGDFDIYVVKYNDIGQVTWAKSFGGPGDDRGTSITLDSSYNIILGGRISQTVSFGNQTLTSNGAWDFFIAKLNNVGSTIWAKSYGSVFNDNVFDICTDSLNNTYSTGVFKGSNVNFGNGNYTSSNGQASNFFIVKLDSTGTTQWVKSGGCTVSDYGISLALSLDQEDLFAIGDYWGGDFIFQGDTIHNIDPNNTTDSYFISMDAQSGTKNFLRNISSYSYTKAKGIAIDKMGNIYITGNTESSSFVSPQVSINDTLISTFGNVNIYLLKYRENGNPVWGKGIGFTNWGHEVRDVQVDNQDRVIVVGKFDGYIACDSFITNNSGGFMALFDSLKTCLSLLSVGSTGANNGGIFYSAAIDKFDNIYIHGGMTYTTTFGTIPFVCNNNYEVFVAKYGFNSLGTNISNEFAKDNSFSVFPNPANNLININSPSEITQLQLFDVFGKLLVEQKSIHSTKLQLSTGGFGNGVYYLKLLSNKGIESKQKVVVCR